MAIQNNNIARYIELLPAAIVWFRMFRAKNYANACQVFSLQWAEWNLTDHPIIEFLTDHFEACSEEYGESAIHTLMTHIREWNYTGPNMKKRWIESSTASDCFDFFGISASHRSSETKWYDEFNGGELMASVGREFIQICGEVVNHSFSPLTPSVGYRDLKDVTDDLSRWVSFVEDVPLIGIRSRQLSLQIRSKLRRPLNFEAHSAIDPDLFF